MLVYRNKPIENSHILFILLFLGSMNVFEKGSIIFLCLSIYAFFRLLRTKLCFEQNMFFTFILAVSIAISSMANYGYEEVVKSISYFSLYFIGYTFYNIAYDKKKYVMKSIFSIFMGFFINILLVFIYNMRIERISARILYSIWSNELISVTLVGLVSSVVIGYSFYAIFLSKDNRLRIISIVALIIVLVLNFETATRTPIVLFVIFYLFMGGLWIIKNNKKLSINIILFFCLVIIIMCLLYTFNVFNIKTYIISSPLVARFESEGLETSRFDIAIEHFKLMFTYFWGGGKIKEHTSNFAHNYLQDAHDMYGIITFILLLFITVLIINNIIILLKRKNLNDIDNVLICMYVSISVQMCVEPVFNGYPILMWVLLYIHGMATAYINRGVICDQI